jgi:hypothetical protein
MRTITLALLMAWSAFPQANPGRVGGPVLGFVFDRASGSIRPLLGIPGSSTLGGSLPGDSAFLNAASDPEYSLALDGDGIAVLVSQAGRRPLPGAAAAASRVVVSPRGTAAALYFAGSATAQIFTGMPDAPQVVRAVSMDRTPDALAVSDNGATLLASSRTGRNGEVVTAYAAGQPSQILHRARRISALAFVPGTSNVLIAEGDGVKLVSPAFGVQTIDTTSLDVVAVAASSDGSKVFAASRGGQVTILDLRTASRTSVACGCVPGVLARLRGNAVFRLNDVGDGPLWLLDGDSAEPRILFVAAPAEGSR